MKILIEKISCYIELRYIYLHIIIFKTQIIISEIVIYHQIYVLMSYEKVVEHTKKPCSKKVKVFIDKNIQVC